VLSASIRPAASPFPLHSEKQRIFASTSNRIILASAYLMSEPLLEVEGLETGYGEVQLYADRLDRVFTLFPRLKVTVDENLEMGAYTSRGARG
jgi:hypothetical protein